MGFFASISKGWTFIKEAFAMGFRDRTLFKPSIYLILSTIVYFTIWVVIAIAAKIDFDTTGGYIFGAVATFGSFLIFYFFCGMTVNMVDVHLKGGKPSMSEAFRDAKQNFIAICILAVISTAVELMAKAARGGRSGNRNVVLAIMASIVEAIWTVMAFLLLPIIIIEDVGLGKALKRAKDMHKGNILLIGIGEIGVRFCTNIIGFLFMIAIVAVVYMGIGLIGGTLGLVVAFIMGGTLLALFAAFTTFVRMAYYTCLYLWAAEVEKVGKEAAVAPGPLAKSMS